MKKGKLLLSLIITLFVSLGFSTIAQAQEIKPATIKVMNLSENDGSELKGQKSADDPFRVNATFELPAGVHENDTTTITLPKELEFNGGNFTPFDIKDSTGAVVAKAAPSADGRQAILTYTKYVETHSNVHGNFFVAVKVAKTAVQDPGKLPIVFDVSGERKDAGTVDYIGIGVPGRALITKSGTALAREDNVIRFQLSINRDQQTIKNAVIEDTIDPAFVAKFMAGTVTVEKGTWNWNKAAGGWTFDNKTIVTDKTAITVTDKKVTINLGDMGPNDQYYITFKAKADYDLVPGEDVPNTATIKGDGKEPTSSSVKVKYTEAGGFAEGYVYGIKVIKTDPSGARLKGAKFDVVRIANGLTVGQIVTDDNGEGSIDKLLIDDYKLVETEAPEGYDKAADMTVEANDFINKVATARIIDKKKVTTTTTKAPTTTTKAPTTTTKAPTTTTKAPTTTTKAPTTTTKAPTTTTKAPTTTTKAPTTTTKAPTTTTKAPTTTTKAPTTTTKAPTTTTKAPTTTTKAPTTTTKAPTTTTKAPTTTTKAPTTTTKAPTTTTKAPTTTTKAPTTTTKAPTTTTKAPTTTTKAPTTTTKAPTTTTKAPTTTTKAPTTTTKAPTTTTKAPTTTTKAPTTTTKAPTTTTKAPTTTTVAPVTTTMAMPTTTVTKATTAPMPTTTVAPKTTTTTVAPTTKVTTKATTTTEAPTTKVTTKPTTTTEAPTTSTTTTTVAPAPKVTTTTPGAPKKVVLPNTGSTNNPVFVVIGLATLAIGGAAYVSYKKN